MKLKLITAAAAAALAGHAHAGLNPTGSFDVVVRLAGASAVDNLMFNSVMKDICASDISVLNKPNVAQTPHTLSNYWGVACKAKTTAQDADIDPSISGLNILFLKRSAGGAAYGATPLLTDPPTPIAQIDPATCTADGTYTSTIASVGTVDAFKCSNTTGVSPSEHVAQDFGISDVNPELFRGPNIPSGFSAVSATAVAAKMGSVKGIVGQVFGIAVSKNLRDALQTAQFGPTSSCIGSETEACMPSLPKSLVHSIFAARVTSWNNVNVGNTPLTSAPGVTAPANTAIKICRRVPGSGTQSVINAVLMGSPCNSGGVTPSTGNTPNIAQGSGSSDVDKCLTAWNTGTQQTIATDLGTGTYNVNPTNQTGWALGVMGLEKAGTNYRFIKLDGVAPTAKNAHDGIYPMWAEATIQWRIDSPYALSGAKLGFATTLKNVVGRAVNLKDLNAELPVPAYMTLGTNPGQVPDAVWDVNNPVIAYTHGTTNTDNCRIPAMNPSHASKTPTGF